jgi:hypothetical protein
MVSSHRHFHHNIRRVTDWPTHIGEEPEKLALALKDVKKITSFMENLGTAVRGA